MGNNRYSGKLRGLMQARQDYEEAMARKREYARQAAQDKLAAEERKRRIALDEEERKRRAKIDEQNTLLFNQSQEDRKARLAENAEQKKRAGLMQAREDFAYDEKRKAYDIQKEKATLDPERLARENVFEFADKLQKGDMAGAVESFNKSGKIKIKGATETKDGYELIDERGQVIKLPKTRAQAISEIGREYSANQKKVQAEAFRRAEDAVYKNGGARFAKQEDIPQGWLATQTPDGSYLAYPEPGKKPGASSSMASGRTGVFGRGNTGEKLYRSFGDILAQKGYDVSALYETVEKTSSRGEKIVEPSPAAQEAVDRMKSHIDRIISANPNATDDEIAVELEKVMGFKRKSEADNADASGTDFRSGKEYAPAPKKKKNYSSVDKYF